MKFSSFIFAVVFSTLSMIAAPFLSVLVNNQLSFPVYDVFLFKCVGAVLIVTGLFTFIYSSKLFKKMGQGTPVPLEPPKHLVMQGFYRYSRNPIYLGYFAIVLGEFLVFGYLSLFFYFLFFVFSLHLYVVYVEEPKLIGRFGSAYEDFCKKVPRWLFC